MERLRLEACVFQTRELFPFSSLLLTPLLAFDSPLSKSPFCTHAFLSCPHFPFIPPPYPNLSLPEETFIAPSFFFRLSGFALPPFRYLFFISPFFAGCPSFLPSWLPPDFSVASVLQSDSEPNIRPCRDLFKETLVFVFLAFFCPCG